MFWVVDFGFLVLDFVDCLWFVVCGLVSVVLVWIGF